MSRSDLQHASDPVLRRGLLWLARELEASQRRIASLEEEVRRMRGDAEPGEQNDEPNVREAITELATVVAEIRKELDAMRTDDENDPEMASGPALAGPDVRV